MTVPAGNLLGWSAAPGEAGGWGLTDPDDTRRLIEAVSRHPRTRWCFTLLGCDGTAVAHGCARGPHPWIPPPAGAARNRDGPDRQQAAALAEFLRDLNITVTPIARGSCCDLDHTVAYPDGPTDECNIAPPCRRHHRVKQAPGWRLEQPEPGVMRWTTPAGRGYTTRPTVYDA